MAGASSPRAEMVSSSSTQQAMSSSPGPPFRELARLAVQYDLRQNLAPTGAPLFCLAVNATRLQQAASAMLPVGTDAQTLRPAPFTVSVSSFLSRAWGRREAQRQSGAHILRTPAPLLVHIAAWVTAAAGPRCGDVAQFARVHSVFASLVWSDGFWGAVLGSRYRSVPHIHAIAAHLGPAPTNHEVCEPPGLSDASTGEAYTLKAPPPLSAEQHRCLEMYGRIAGGICTDNPFADAQSSDDERPIAADASALPLTNPMPATVLVMTEHGATVVLLEAVGAHRPVLEFFGEVSSLPLQPGDRGFFGGQHEVWVDVVLTQSGAPDTVRDVLRRRRRCLCVSAARHGNEARWARFCRPGEAPTCRMEVVFGGGQLGDDGGIDSEVQGLRLVLVADRDLASLSEVTWLDLQLCSSPCVCAAAMGEDPELRERRTLPVLRNLERLTDVLREQKRVGVYPGAAGAHAFVAL